MSYAASMGLESKKLTDSRLFVFTQIVLCSLFVALCARIRIPLPFTPVPITFQAFAVMLVGGTLGGRKGALVMLLYIAEAMLGLPVLSGGRVDPLVLFSPVAGYIVGFVFQAYCMGKCVEKAQSIGPSLFFFYSLLASFATLTCGALWLSAFVGLENAILMGIIPFIPGDTLKVFAATQILSSRHRS